MNCEEFRNLSQAIARDETLDPANLERALEHADSCEECDSLLDESEALTSELRALAKHYAADEAPHHVEAKLLAVLEQQKPGTDRLHSPERPKVGIFGIGAEIVFALRRHSSAILGAAAAIVLVLALTGWPAALWQTGWLANLGKAGHGRGTPVSSAILTASPNGGSQADLISDSFVPLSGAYDLASLNDDPIVRVVLSDNDLETLGLPVGESSDDQIVADLIIANDGTPQAIRFVSW